MASDRAIAMKHAQAAEDSANALKQMAEKMTALEAQNVALLEKLEALTIMVNNNLNPENLLDALSAEAQRRNMLLPVIDTKPETTKRGK
jgi:hypothetical protein